MNQSDRQTIIKEAFESTLSHADVESYLQRALDQSYWQRLNPDLSIGEEHSAAEFEAAPLNELQTAVQMEQLHREGYFQTPPALQPDVVRRMRLAVEKLREEHWPAVFAYVYDEFWQVVRTPSLVRLISGFLGRAYRQNSLIWAYYVAPVRGAQGWHPHSDSGDESRLTVWVPLTDATLENGCMYVIPRDRLPNDLLGSYEKLDSVTHAQLDRLLQSTKALPSPAGAYLGWNHDLIHWGSVSSGRVEPRISVAMEFVGPDVVSRPDELPLFDPLTPPPFFERIRAIGKGLLTYGRLEPSKRKYAELGARLAETT
jgi:hypothetical protein